MCGLAGGETTAVARPLAAVACSCGESGLHGGKEQQKNDNSRMESERKSRVDHITLSDSTD